MSVSVARHPVFISHIQELEQMLYFTAALQDRLKARNKDSGEKYDCLLRVRQKCADLLLQMYAEEDPAIILMDDLDRHWVQLIVSFVKNVLLKDQRKVS